MKKFITVLTFIGLTTFTFGQDFKAPKQGAKIYAQEYTINLDEDGQTTFDLWIVRSKLAKRAKFEMPTLVSSSELTFEVEQDAENKDHYVVTAFASGVPVGQYTTTVAARSKGTQKVTGTTLSINVIPTTPIASKDGE
ncbi:hypothetical protein [Ekhidna sp.]|uniref:hypothetical protein n=1 Tax=Ekhidna sp. TaxID=2608089 RepID=UPI003B514FD2